MYQNSIFT